MSGLKRLGIDEIALRKGQRDYVVVLVDLERSCLIGMAQSRQQVEIEKALESFGVEVLAQIEEVSIDLSGNYRGLVKRLLPNAAIVADRFHVMKIINTELNQVRRQEIKAQDQQPDETQREQAKATLKKSKYALLKPEENLTEKQRETLEEVKNISPLLAQMHQQKERFREIFDTQFEWEEGLFELGDWLMESATIFTHSVQTIDRWLEEIVNYFDHRTTNGIVEGINNKLKLIKRSGYGFRNFENFRLRCLICWHLNFNSA